MRSCCEEGNLGMGPILLLFYEDKLQKGQCFPSKISDVCLIDLSPVRILIVLVVKSTASKGMKFA